MTGSVTVGIEKIIRVKGIVRGSITAQAGFSGQQFCDIGDRRRSVTSNP